MEKTQQTKDYIRFKDEYENVSGLSIPFSYFEKSEVFIQKVGNKIIGGFILSNTYPLRTVEYFVSEVNKKTITSKFSKEIFCEVCCLWIDKKYRSDKYLNAKFWLQLAWNVKRQSKDIIIFGTNSEKLAKLYGYPKVLLLYHRDKVNSKSTFLFLVKRDEFFGGILELILSKFFNRYSNKKSQSKTKLRKRIINEISG